MIFFYLAVWEKEQSPISSLTKGGKIKVEKRWKKGGSSHSSLSATLPRFPQVDLLQTRRDSGQLQPTPAISRPTAQPIYFTAAAPIQPIAAVNQSSICFFNVFGFSGYCNILWFLWISHRLPPSSICDYRLENESFWQWCKTIPLGVNRGDMPAWKWPIFQPFSPKYCW